MKLRIDKEILNSKLDNVAHAVASKSPLPALTGIKITANDEGVELVGSNADISIKAIINKDNVEIEEKGSVLVDGKLLGTIVRAINNGTLDFSTKDNVLIIRGGKAEYKINIMDIDKYPNIEFDIVNEMQSINLDSKDFFNIIRKVIVSVGTSEKKPILTGVNIFGKDNKIVFASTDAFRLSYYTLEKETEEFNIVVPGSSLNEMLKCSFEGDQAQIGFFGNRFIVHIGSFTFVTRLLEGQYPSVDRLIPTEFKCTFEFNRMLLLNATNRISIMSSDSSTKDKEISHNAIKFETLGTKSAKITSDSSSYGKASEEVEFGKEVELEEPVFFAFASKNLIAALSSFESEFIKLNYVGEVRPFTITTETEPNLIQLILPVRLS